jgi:transcriptional regulator with XRE-family HTH domain
MTTALQVAANASNAAQSTGPKTSSGKARSSKNALRHGLRSELPVLPGERAEDWQAHRDGVVRALAPAGGLEAALTERAGLSQRAVSHWEQGLREPVWSNVVALATTLGVDVGAFLVEPSARPAQGRGRPRKQPPGEAAPDVVPEPANGETGQPVGRERGAARAGQRDAAEGHREGQGSAAVSERCAAALPVSGPDRSLVLPVFR